MWHGVYVGVDFTQVWRGGFRLLQMLYREVDDSATNLNGLVVTWQKRGPLLDENESSKLALVILKKEFALFKLDFGVTSADRNVINAQVTFMATAQLENCFV